MAIPEMVIVLFARLSSWGSGELVVVSRMYSSTGFDEWLQCDNDQRHFTAHFFVRSPERYHPHASCNSTPTWMQHVKDLEGSAPQVLHMLIECPTQNLFRLIFHVS